MLLPAVGDVFHDHYRIDALLGHGGFATVFRATSLGGARPVALKVLEAGTGGYDSQTRARFRREVAIVAQLRDAHTVTLLDHGETREGLLFMVFELIEGQDLRELLSAVGSLPTAAAAHVLRQLLCSLREAHDAGLLHRDIKPENIRIFEQDGDPLTLKLLDFGIARATDSGHPSITKTGELVGTPRYMSPEQLRGQPLTTASDIYSAGMVGLEMLFGADVLPGNRWTDQLDRLMSGHVIGLPGIDDAGGPLLAVLRRMTDPSPERRYASVAAVLAALDGERPPPVNVETTSWWARGNNRPIALICGGFALVISIALAAGLRSESTDVPQAAPAATRRADSIIRGPGAPTPEAIALPGSPDAGELPDVLDTPRCGPFVGTGYLDGGVNGRDRWLTHIPPVTDSERLPLVVILRGLGQTSHDFMRASGFARLADREGFVVVAPESDKLAPWIQTETNYTRLREIVESTTRQSCVDPRRVFVVGQGHSTLPSNLSCESWVTAIATHAFPQHRGGLVCGDDPKPYLLAAPEKSGHEPFGGGPSCTGRQQYSIDEVEATWRTRNGCGDQRRDTFTHKDGACYSWDCEVPFTSCHIDGGHMWPGSPARDLDVLGCDGPSSEFPLAEQVWRFFASAPALPDQRLPSSP